MLFYTLVAIVYGALTFLFVRFFIWLLLSLTTSSSVGGQRKMANPGTVGEVFPHIWPAPGSSPFSSLSTRPATRT